MPQAMPLELLASTPPIVQAVSRVGSEPTPVPGQAGVERGDGHPRIHPHPQTPVEDLQAAEVPADVHQELVGHALAGQARPAGPEGQRHPAPARELQQPAHLGGTCGRDDRHREEQEVRRVVGLGVAGELAVAHLAGIGHTGPEVVEERHGTIQDRTSTRAPPER
jgi:hypothetical protein